MPPIRKSPISGWLESLPPPVRALSELVFGSPEDIMPMPVGIGISKVVRAKRALIDDDSILKEIKETARVYREAKKTGDAIVAKEAGKRLAELQRIGTGGASFKPSGDTITSKGSGTLPPSKTIMNARLQAALDAKKRGEK